MAIGSNPPPAWYADPFAGEPRLRWWTGAGWTAWVVRSPVDEPSIAWRAELAELPSPICWGMAVLRVAAAPPLRLRAGSAEPEPARPTELEPARSAAPTRRRPRRRRLVVAAAIVVVVAIAAASAVLLLQGSVGLGALVDPGHPAHRGARPAAPSAFAVARPTG